MSGHSRLPKTAVNITIGAGVWAVRLFSRAAVRLAEQRGAAVIEGQIDAAGIEAVSFFLELPENPAVRAVVGDGPVSCQIYQTKDGVFIAPIFIDAPALRVTAAIGLRTGGAGGGL